MMDIRERLSLIMRNTTEVITEEELKKLLEEKKRPVIYHGFEPSGQGIHIGYFVGINKHIDFQKAGLKLKLLLADLHAWLNEKGSLGKIEKIAELYLEGFKALGVDITKADVVYGSDFQLHHEYNLDILKLALRVRLLRAKRAMTIIGREEENPHIAQALYPLMQSVDIKHLNADIAFGDMAQRKIHMLARENLPSIEYKIPIVIHHEDIVGLNGGKMSSSIPESRIMIDEQPEEVIKKVMAAFCPPKQLRENPILQICKYIIFTRTKELKIERERKYGGDLIVKNYKELEELYSNNLHPLDLKKAVAASLIEILKPARERLNSKRMLGIKDIIKTLN